ncbi:hypothetical protein Tco_1270356 [Tanacetum coccineum]
MDRRPVITELRYNADSSDWTDVLSCFCRKVATEDRRFATKLHMLREEMANVCEKIRNLAVELSSMRGIIVTGKAAEFVFDTVGKDEAEMAQLRELERQMELRALEKELFIQKLGVVQPPVGLIIDVESYRCCLGGKLMRSLRKCKIIVDDELREGVRKWDAYIKELQMFEMFDSSDEVRESVKMMKGMQVDDMQKASRLLLMAMEV